MYFVAFGLVFRFCVHDLLNVLLRILGSQCPSFVQSSCESSCRQQNQVMVPDAIDNNKCPICQCNNLINEDKNSENGK